MSSSEDIRQPSSPDDQQAKAKGEEGDNASRKKRFQPLKSLRKLFTGKKKSKNKEEKEAPRARSAESVLKTEAEEQSALSKKHSMSDDSVFNSGKPRETNPSEYTKSMEALTRAGLQGHSDNGMDTEGDDFFRPMASGSSLKPGHLSDPGSDVDLDAIPQGSTTNLSNPHAYHKLAVKPKKIGRSSRIAATSRATATSPVLIHVTEEEKHAIESDDIPNADYDVEKMSEDVLEEKQTGSLKLEHESHLAHNVVKIAPEKESKTSPKNESKITKKNEYLRTEHKIMKDEENHTEDDKQDNSSKANTEISKTKIEISNTNTEISNTTKTEIGNRKTEIGNTKTEINQVVLRKSRIPAAGTDVSKRQTIASETESTPFGERIIRTSLVVDSTKWDALDRQKENQHEQPVRGDTELAKMFDRVKKRSVKMSHTPEEGEKAKSKEYPSRHAATPTTLSSVENRPTSFILQTEKNESPKKTQASTSQLTTEKADLAQDRSPATIKKHAVLKSLSNNENGEKVSNLKRTPSKSPASDAQKVELTDSMKRESVAHVKDSTATAQNNKTALIIEKEVPKKDREAKNNMSFKTKSSSDHNKTAAQLSSESGDGPAPSHNVKESQTSAPAMKRKEEEVASPKLSSPIRSGSKRAEPKKLDFSASDSGGGPSWIAMARKKTTGWNEDKDKEIEKKESKPDPIISQMEKMDSKKQFFEQRLG